MPAPALTLRLATPMDDAFLLRVYASTREDELAPLGWPEAQRRIFLQSQFAAQRQSYRAQFPTAERSLILCDGDAIGSMIVSRGADEIRLVDLALLAPHRGRGFGTRLLRDLCAESAARQTPVRLSVLTNNRAARLYARLGFVPLQHNGLHVEMERRPPAD